MIELPLLSIMLFLPFLGSLFVLLTPDSAEYGFRNSRSVAFLTTLLTFALALILYFDFDPQVVDFQFQEKLPWLKPFKITYHIGVDGLSLSLILLTTLIMPIAVLSAWQSITHKVKEFMVALLILETFIIGSFCALDLVLFYLFFEAVLIPMFFIIGMWGGEQRIFAAYKFFLYTFLGSIFMLAALLALYLNVGTLSTPKLLLAEIDPIQQKCLWWGFFIAFAVKIPMWPVHTWLPDAHVQAPTAGSIILAALLLKMGGYGMIRFLIPIFPDASLYYTPLVILLSLVAIIYGSVVALSQQDIKKIIAYSSVAHMGYVTLGLFCFNLTGFQGATFQMLSHGILSAALFFCIGIIYKRCHTRDLNQLGGISSMMPGFAKYMMIFTMGAVALPGTSGFIGEILTIFAAMEQTSVYAALATLGMLFGAAYMLILYRKVNYGTHSNTLDQEKLQDLQWEERLSLFVLAATVIILGLYTKPILQLTEPYAARILEDLQNRPSTDQGDQ